MSELLDKDQALVAMAKAVSVLANALAEALDTASREAGFDMEVDISFDEEKMTARAGDGGQVLISRMFTALRTAAALRKAGQVGECA